MVTSATDILEEYECLFPHRIRIENIKAAPERYKMSDRPARRIKASPSVAQSTDSVELPARQDSAEDAPERDTSMLDPTAQKVLKKMPIGEALAPDELVDSELSITDIMVSMTMLEINKFVRNLPGGKFVRI